MGGWGLTPLQRRSKCIRTAPADRAMEKLERTHKRRSPMDASHWRAIVGRSRITSQQQLYTDTGHRESERGGGRERERIRKICASNMTWWWWYMLEEMKESDKIYVEKHKQTKDIYLVELKIFLFVHLFIYLSIHFCQHVFRLQICHYAKTFSLDLF